MGSILSALPLLACPVGMGLMMWMMRGKKEPAAVAAPGHSVELLREERHRLDTEIEDLETVDATRAPR